MSEQNAQATEAGGVQSATQPDHDKPVSQDSPDVPERDEDGSPSTKSSIKANIWAQPMVRVPLRIPSDNRLTGTSLIPRTTWAKKSSQTHADWTARCVE